MTVLGDPIVRLDLRRMRVRLEAERANEPGAQLRPVDVRQGGHVCIEVAHCTIHLAEDLQLCDALALPLEARGDVRELLADGGGVAA